MMATEAELARRQRLCDWARERENAVRDQCCCLAAECARLREAVQGTARELAELGWEMSSVAAMGHARRYREALQARLSGLRERLRTTEAHLAAQQAAAREAARETAGFERLVMAWQRELARREARADTRAQDERATWQAARSDS